VKYVLALFKFSKNSRVQRLLHTLKYESRPEIGVKLGKYYGSILEHHYKTEFDLVIPVPLHKSRQRQRGYNQSAEFGRGLAEILCADFDEQILDRVTITETQTKKTKLLRWKNVKHVFNVRQPDRLLGKRILLVDDVITTGATLEACADKILEHRVQSLSIACIAAAQ
jgi:ComF family protein